MKIGINIGAVNRGSAIDQLVPQAQAAEADGFDSVWMANIFGADAIVSSAIIGRETKSIEIGTGIVPTYPRHPHAMAQLALTAQDAARGRFSLGIGLSHKVVIEDMYGMSWAKPYSHMKAYLAALVPLIRSGAVDVDEGEYRINAPVEIPVDKPCPILVAALAPKMLALAGSVADGTVTWMTGVKTIREHVAPRIREAAAAAGRPEPRIVVGLPIAVVDDAQAARAAANTMFEAYGQLPSYRAMLDREGGAQPGDVALFGSAAEVNDRLDALAEAGATEFKASLFSFGDDAAASLARTRELLCARARSS